MEQNKVYPMMEHSQPSGLCGVRVPAAHEGVGQALRGSYREPNRSVPAEMTQLLDRLR
jgi:hypothetical protein